MSTIEIIYLGRGLAALINLGLFGLGLGLLVLPGYSWPARLTGAVIAPVCLAIAILAISAY